MSSEAYCQQCGSWYDRVRNIKFCSEDCRVEYRQQQQGTPEARHKLVLRLLELERAPKFDKLWSLEYYASILFGLDGRCLYCEGPLNLSGHCLDRLDNEENHLCWNVVVPVCSDCNSIRGDILTFEEMLILKPSLTEIREIREREKAHVLRRS